jgi:hypothetical protein
MKKEKWRGMESNSNRIYGAAIWVNYGADGEWWLGEKIREIYNNEREGI